MLLPALATVPALVLDPKWGLAYAAVVVVGIPATLLIRDAKLWLLLIGALSAFNFTKFVSGDARPGVEDLSLLTIRAVDIPILALMIFAFLGSGAAGGDGTRSRPDIRRALLVGGGFVAWSLTGVVDAIRPDAVLVQSLAYARLVVALAVVALCADSTERIRWGAAGIFLALAAQCAIAFAQYLTGSSFGLYEHFQEDTAIGMLTRSGGTLNPTVLSEYIGLLAPMVLATAFASSRPLITASLLGLFGAAVTATFMTLSRGGLASVAITTLLMVVWISLRRETTRARKLLLVGGTLTLMMVLGGVFSASVVARVSDVTAEMEGDAGRLPQFKQAAAMIMANPVFGVGLGNYVETMGRYGPMLPYPVHNKFLLVTAETGIPGGMLYLTLWVSTLFVFVRGAGREPSGRGVIFAGAAAAVLGTLINMTTDVYGTGGAPELTLFIVTGLGLGLAGQRDAR